VGGPGRSVAWATAELESRGWSSVTAVQQRTWNLSAIWRLDGPDGRRVWLKQVPPFFDHEGAVLRWLDGALPGVAPHLIAAGDEGRVLLGDVPGVDGYDADVAQVHAIAAVHHRVQVRAAAANGELAAAGVPDRRGPRLGEWIRASLAGHEPAVDAVLPDLDARLGALAGCGLPDTLVHGDLHGGNVRLGEGPPVIFDWGDSSLGNPAFDVLRLTGHLDATDRDEVVGAWAARWRTDAPGADPERAVALVGPLAPLYGAAAYAMFLAHIEPSEHPYHRDDVPDALAAVASLVAAERPTVGG
jgi:hypothetical protein